MRTTKAMAVSAALLAHMGTALAESRTAQAMRHDAPKGITEAFFVCVDKAGFDQTLISICIRSEKAIQDRRINKAYGRLMDKLTGSTKESVQLAERAWIDFNTRSVAAETDLGGTDRVANVDVATAELHRY